MCIRGQGRNKIKICLLSGFWIKFGWKQTYINDLPLAFHFFYVMRVPGTDIFTGTAIR